jgi:hypothetical protein
MLPLRAVLPGKVFGLTASVDGTGKVTQRNNDGSITLAAVHLLLSDAADEVDQGVALAVVSAHDPVTLRASKTSLTADGLDSVTISVTAPALAAAAVILLVAVNGVPFGEQAVVLAGGLGSHVLTALDPATIVISLKTPGNRSTDVLTIQAG